MAVKVPTRRGALVSTVLLATHRPPEGDVAGRWRLVAEPTSAGLARRLVIQALDSTVMSASDAVQRRAALATGELVANALLHARPPLDLEVRRTVRGWVIGVSDGSRTAPTPRVAEQLAENGRGWLIIDRATERYGWTPTDSGKLVWVELWER